MFARTKVKAAIPAIAADALRCSSAAAGLAQPVEGPSYALACTRRG